MAFTPVRMADREGRVCRVGSATQREHLLTQGYQVVTEPEPEPEPASVKAEPKPAPKPVAKTEPADAKTK
ncbi:MULTISPECIES: hypothetical protein [Nocardia]|uniref:hypothetical protein n=1 Tax=Nocardia TaxID=1817 RepID=UPI00130041A2|nr:MULTISPECIES: hypothetical protein [Nocardia]